MECKHETVPRKLSNSTMHYEWPCVTLSDWWQHPAVGRRPKFAVSGIVVVTIITTFIKLFLRTSYCRLYFVTPNTFHIGVVVNAFSKDPQGHRLRRPSNYKLMPSSTPTIPYQHCQRFPRDPRQYIPDKNIWFPGLCLGLGFRLYPTLSHQKYRSTKIQQIKQRKNKQAHHTVKESRLTSVKSAI